MNAKNSHKAEDVNPIGERGHTLYYRVDGTSEIRVLHVEREPEFRVIGEDHVVDGNYVFPQAGRHYDVAQDEERLLLVRKADAQRPTTSDARVDVVINWGRELLERVPEN